MLIFHGTTQDRYFSPKFCSKDIYLRDLAILRVTPCPPWSWARMDKIHMKSIKISPLEELRKYMSESVRIQFANTYLFSLLNYGAPLMFTTNAKINIKMHNLHMACSRWVLGNFRFKQSCSQICKSIGKKFSSEEFLQIIDLVSRGLGIIYVMGSPYPNWIEK